MDRQGYLDAIAVAEARGDHGRAQRMRAEMLGIVEAQKPPGPVRMTSRVAEARRRPKGI